VIATTPATVLGFELGWRAGSAELREMIATLAAELMAGRASTRRRDDFRLRVEVIACNVIAAKLAGLEDWVTAPRSTSLKRFRNAGSDIYGEQFVSILDALTARRLIEQRDWFYDSERTERRVPSQIRGAESLWRMLPPHLDWSDMRMVPRRELIELRSQKYSIGSGATERHWDVMPFEQTDETRRIQREVLRINAFLADHADITFDGKRDFAFVMQGEGSPIAKLVTRHHVGQLRRIFNNGSFEDGGRLEGGFWLHLPKADRQRLRLEGEPVVSVDHNSMFARLAYHHAGKAWPFDATDAYGVLGCAREGCKIVFSSMLFADKPRKNLPTDALPHFTGYRARQVYTALEAKHAAIRDRFYAGLGHKLFRVESDLLVENMLALIERGITAVPLHDAFLCPLSRAKAVQEQMMVTATSKGMFLPVSTSEPYV
jgi:hypothetical protein